MFIVFGVRWIKESDRSFAKISSGYARIKTGKSGKKIIVIHLLARLNEKIGSPYLAPTKLSSTWFQSFDLISK